MQLFPVSALLNWDTPTAVCPGIASSCFHCNKKARSRHGNHKAHRAVSCLTLNSESLPIPNPLASLHILKSSFLFYLLPCPSGLLIAGSTAVLDALDIPVSNFSLDMEILYLLLLKVYFYFYMFEWQSGTHTHT